VYAVSGAPALRLLIFAPLVAAIDQLLTTLMLAAQQQRSDVRVLAISVVAYASLLFALVPSWGVVGAAAATLLTGIVQLAVRFRILRHQLPSAPGAALLLRPLAAAGAMVLALITVPATYMAVRLGLALVAYALALVAFGAVGRAEILAARARLLTLPNGGRA
jgi:O-antigen/teichoic acid export membrane protein